MRGIGRDTGRMNNNVRGREGDFGATKMGVTMTGET